MMPQSRKHCHHSGRHQQQVLDELEEVLARALQEGRTLRACQVTELQNRAYRALLCEACGSDNRHELIAQRVFKMAGRGLHIR